MSDKPTCPRCGEPQNDGKICLYCSLLALPPSPMEQRQIALRAAGRSWLEVLRDTRIERRRALKPEDGVHRPVVYYMRMDGLVKIGTTANIAQRLGAIRPQGVLAVEFGSYALERERHRQFSHHHSHGEWFWIVDRMWAHVAELRSRPLDGFLSVDDWLTVWSTK